VSETAERLYGALIRYEAKAAGLGPQSNSGPPPSGWSPADPVDPTPEPPPRGPPDVGASS